MHFQNLKCDYISSLNYYKHSKSLLYNVCFQKNQSVMLLKLYHVILENDLEKERFASRTITIPVTVDSVIKLYTNKVRKKKK